MADEPLLAAMQTAVDVDPSNHTLRAHLADMLARAGRHAEALGHAARVLEVVPDDPTARRVLAMSGAALAGELPPPDPPPPPTTSHPGATVDEPPLAAIPNTADDLLERWKQIDPLEELPIDTPTVPTVQLADVGGMEQVKARLRTSFLDPLRHEQIAAQFGKKLRNGLLLWGPPGCGKTFIAKALAGELGIGFFEVGLNDVLDMWIGGSEHNLHQVFEAARAAQPAVLFFDEIDALGQRRTNLRESGATFRNLVNLFLTELDGAATNNDGLLVLAATNHPWDVDPALLRPGRFDRTVLVLPPDAPAREAILRLHLRGRPTDGPDLAKIVKTTDGYSGADLALVCEQATEQAMQASMRSGTIRPITQGDLADAVKAVKPSIGAWIDTARNYATYGNGTGMYDDLIEYLSRRRGR
ncbi:MAG: AAA family ATPase [Desertimonas sp.]